MLFRLVRSACPPAIPPPVSFSLDELQHPLIPLLNLDAFSWPLLWLTRYPSLVDSYPRLSERLPAWIPYWFPFLLDDVHPLSGWSASSVSSLPLGWGWPPLWRDLFPHHWLGGWIDNIPWQDSSLQSVVLQGIRYSLMDEILLEQPLPFKGN